MWEIKESFKKMLDFWKMLNASPRSGLTLTLALASENPGLCEFR